MAISFPIEGRNHMIDVALHNGTKVTQWYIMLFEGNYTPQDSDTAANIVSRATEIVAYSETLRPAFVVNAPANGETSNAGALAQVTLTAPKTIRGFAITSSAGKGTGTGVLLAHQQLATPVAYNVGDIVKIPVTIAALNLA